MNTELQNKVWSILPKEFKEEVKKMYESTQLISLQPFEYVERADRYAGAMCAIFGKDNLTSDADEEEMLTCEKSKAMQFYSHLLDLIESERMSEHYSEWCDLEREYIALFGENAFADYFSSKCLPDEDAHEDNFATKKSQPAEPKEDKHFDNRLHIAAMAMQGILSNADRMKVYERIATEPPCEELAVVVARNALRYADTLMAKAKKGGQNE